MKLTNPHNRLYASLIFFSAVIFALFFLAILPAISAISSINLEIAAQKKELEQKSIIGKNVKISQKSLEQAKADMPILDSFYLAKSDQLALLTKIEAMASTSGVAIKLQPDFSGLNKSGTISKVPLAINATGNYLAIEKFLSRIDAAPFILTVNTYSLALSGKDQITLDIDSQAYLQ